MIHEEWLDYSKAPRADIFQREIGMAAMQLVRFRNRLGGLAPVDPALFFGAVGEIAQDFYESYAPDCSLDDFPRDEIMECVMFAKHRVQDGRHSLMFLDITDIGGGQ